MIDSALLGPVCLPAFADLPLFIKESFTIMSTAAKPDIRAIARLVAAEGNLVQGQSELALSPALAAAAGQVIDEGLNHYTFFEGVPELRKVLAEKIKLHNGIAVDPDAKPIELLVTPGATGALVSAAHAFLKGASALVFEPYYPYHVRVLETAGARAEVFPLRGDRLELDPDAFRAACRAAASRDQYPLRAIIACSPSNPTGKSFTRAELDLIAEICHELDLICLADEVYEHFTLRPEDHISIASLPGMFERTVTCNSFSKSWRISGWRLGYAYGPGSLASRLHGPGNVFYVCAPTPLQHALARVLMAEPSYYDDLRGTFSAKRERVATALESFGFFVYPSSSAFYLWARIPDRFPSAMKLNEMLLEKGKVAGVPGSAFADDPAWDRWMRFCIAREDSLLDGAVERIASALA
jgi:aminotransferase